MGRRDGEGAGSRQALHYERVNLTALKTFELSPVWILGEPMLFRVDTPPAWHFR